MLTQHFEKPYPGEDCLIHRRKAVVAIEDIPCCEECADITDPEWRIFLLHSEVENVSAAVCISGFVVITMTVVNTIPAITAMGP